MKYINILIPIVFLSLLILVLRYRSKSVLRRIHRDYIELYLIENGYDLVKYYEIRKLRKGKNSYRFTPFMAFGNPSFTVLVGVEATDKNKSARYFEVRVKFLFSSVQKIEFFE